jgi:hypothetical protein
MARTWFVTPYRIIPGSPVPGHYNSRDGGWDGPSPRDMESFRGPADTCALAVEIAVAWRGEGRRSDLWLLLVEDGVATHCNKFDDAKVGL